VTQPVQPTETLVVSDGHAGHGHTQVHAVDQITITRDGASNFLSELVIFWFSPKVGLYLKHNYTHNHTVSEPIIDWLRIVQISTF
jgi:hypothetical protein